MVSETDTSNGRSVKTENAIQYFLATRKVPTPKAVHEQSRYLIYVHDLLLAQQT